MTGFDFTRRELGFAAFAGFGLLGLGNVAHGQAPFTKVTVSKDPSCGCCTGWANHIRGAGFPVEIVETADLEPVKKRLGVPDELAACHTAEVDGYVVEGHVPATAVERLLRERPKAVGLAVRGMPAGSPGMEVPGLAPETYDVVLFGPAGRSRYARFTGGRKV